MKMLGSAMLAWAASKEEVLEKLKKDVYTENQVWDWSKARFLSLFVFSFDSILDRDFGPSHCLTLVCWSRGKAETRL